MSDIITKNMSAETMVAQINAEFSALRSEVESAKALYNTTKSALIKYNVPIATSVIVGDLVYWNAETSKFEPALAAVTTDAAGRSIEAAATRVEGMIVGVDASSITGTLLQSGSFVSETCIKNCLCRTTATTDATPGTYFLSGAKAGKAIAAQNIPINSIRRPVFTYYGDGAFNITLLYQTIDAHMHASLTLAKPNYSTGGVILSGTTGWTTEQGTKKVGTVTYAQTYVMSSAESEEIGDIDSDCTAIFKNGKLVQPGDTSIIIVDGVLWRTAPTGVSTTSADDEITLFNHYSLAYGSPIVHKVLSTNDTALSVATNGGIVKLTPNEFIKDSIANATNAAYAVRDVSGHTVRWTPIISKLINGSGIDVYNQGSGVYNINLSRKLDTPLEAFSINFNGAVQSTIDLLTYIVFPKGRNSSIIITLPVEDYPNAYLAQVWCMVNGSFPTLKTESAFIPNPTKSGSVNLADRLSDQKKKSATLSGLTVDSGVLCYSETPNSVALAAELGGTPATTDGTADGADGLLIAKISTISAPTDNIYMLRVGFKITERQTDVSDQQRQGTDASNGNTVIGSGTATTAITKFHCVRFNQSGGLEHCDARNINHADTCVGIALADAAAGATCSFGAFGAIDGLSFADGAGVRVYIGENGILQTTISTNSVFMQCIGVTTSSNAMTINIGQAVVKYNV